MNAVTPPPAAAAAPPAAAIRSYHINSLARDQTSWLLGSSRVFAHRVTMDGVIL